MPALFSSFIAYVHLASSPAMRGKSLCVLLLEPRDELTPLCEVLRCVPYALLLGVWLVLRGEYPVSFLKP